MVVAVTDDGNVVGGRQYVVGIRPVANHLATPIIHLGHVAVEVDRIGDVGTMELPRIGVFEPILRVLDLFAAFDLLPKHSIFIADAIADAGVAQGRHRFEQASAQPPEPAITKRRLGLEGQEDFKVDVEVGQRLAAVVVEPLRQQACLEQAPGKEFEGKIIDPFRAIFEIATPCANARGTQVAA